MWEGTSAAARALQNSIITCFFLHKSGISYAFWLTIGSQKASGVSEELIAYVFEANINIKM
jgi:hypothetical protein